MINYKPLMKLLIDKGMKKQELVENIPISWATLAKMNTNEYVALEVIDKLCTYLNCTPNDIIEHEKESLK